MSESRGLKRENTPEYAVLRVDKQLGRWEAIPVALINDSQLGLDTRAFAVWLLTKPDGWEIRARALPSLLKIRSGHIGRDRARRFLSELEASGYLTRTLAHSRDGRWIWRYAFRAVPRGSTVDGFAGDGPAVDGSPGAGKGVDIIHTLRNSTLNEFRLKPTTTEGSPTLPEDGVVGDGFEIRYPDCLKGEVLASAHTLVAACPTEHRQAVLDEIAAIAGRSVVRNPIGLLHRLIEKVKSGTFVPNLSVIDRKLGRGRAGALPSRHHAVQSTPQPVPIADTAKRILNDLRARLKPDAE